MEGGRAGAGSIIRDLLADGRCSLSVLDFLSTTGVGRLVPAEEDAGRGVSEWERWEREEERRVVAGSWVPGGRNNSSSDARLHGVHGRGGVGDSALFFRPFFRSFLSVTILIVLS